MAPFSERFRVELLPMGLGQSEAMLICTPVNCLGKVPFSSLGMPLDNTELALLDDDGNPVADGEVFHIYGNVFSP